MEKTNAEVIEHLAESTKVLVEAGLGEQKTVAEVLGHIASLVKPYISAEHKEIIETLMTRGEWSNKTETIR